MDNAFEKLQKFLKHKTNLVDVEIEDISSYFKYETADRREVLVDYAEVCHHYYFIVTGVIRNYTINSEGIEISHYFAYTNMLTSALPSFINQQPAYEYLQCLNKSKFLKIHRKDFYNLLQQYAEWDRLYRRILEERFITSQKLIYGFQGFSALEKIQWVKENQPELLRRISNKMLASYLGISPSTLSRLKSKL